MSFARSFIARCTVVLLVVAAMLGTLPVGSVNAQTAQRCFAETNQCISGAIRQYWERNGGLAVFGFPITAQSAETVEGQALQVQWFERDRLEIQANGRVTAGRLGVERLDQQGTPWQFGPREAADVGCLAFAETGHRTCGAFAAYWQRNGGLERFGFPITGAFETEIQGIRLTVQYFERRRFELHDANTVLLGLLGAEVLAGRSGAPAPAPAPAPEPAPAPGAPPSPCPSSCAGPDTYVIPAPPQPITSEPDYGPNPCGSLPTAFCKPRGSQFGFFTSIFAPNEPILVLLRYPDGQIIELFTNLPSADANGAFGLTFQTTDAIPRGDYSVFYGGVNSGATRYFDFRVY